MATTFKLEHSFPDIPVDLFERYGINYVTGSLPKQVFSAWHKVVRLSLPNGFLDEAKANPVGTVTKLVTPDPRKKALKKARARRSASAA